MKQLLLLFFVVIFITTRANAQSPISLGSQKNFENKALKTSFKYDVKAKKEYRRISLSQEYVNGQKIVFTKIYLSMPLAKLN